MLYILLTLHMNPSRELDPNCEFTSQCIDLEHTHLEEGGGQGLVITGIRLVSSAKRGRSCVVGCNVLQVVHSINVGISGE